MDLSHLTPADIAEVMRIERTPGYEDVVGRFEAEEHALQMASADVRYVGLRANGGLAGFVILQRFNDPEVLLRRIAVSQVEAGVGTRLVRGVMDWVFQTTPAKAMILDVALGNRRAKHVYQREGFSQYAQDDVHYFMRVTRQRWSELR